MGCHMGYHRGLSGREGGELGRSRDFPGRRLGVKGPRFRFRHRRFTSGPSPDQGDGFSRPLVSTLLLEVGKDMLGA